MEDLNLVGMSRRNKAGFKLGKSVHDAAIGEARRLGARYLEANALVARAGAHLRQGNAAAALTDAADATAVAQAAIPPIPLTALFSCYTGFVARNVTIRISDEAILWARRQAAEENTSVSKLVGRMLEDQMRCTDEYWAAYEKFKRIKPIPGIDAAHRLTREEAHERRR